MRTEPSASTAAALTSASIFRGGQSFFWPLKGSPGIAESMGKKSPDFFFFFVTAYVFKASSTEVAKGLKSERDLRYHRAIITAWSEQCREVTVPSSSHFSFSFLISFQPEVSKHEGCSSGFGQ